MSSVGKKQAPSIRDPQSVFERETRRVIERSSAQPMAEQLLLTGVALTTGTTRVPHALGRAVKGFIVVDKTATGDVWRDPTVTGQSTTILPLIASASMTVSLIIF